MERAGRSSGRNAYIETVFNDLVTAPDSTVRGYLAEQLTPQIMGDLTRRCDRALASQLPIWLAEHPKDVAFDLHDVPYYGKDDDPDCWVCRGEACARTTRFYHCATAYVMHKDVRFTLAVEFVRPGEDLIAILNRPVRRTKALKIRLKRGNLDKGFCAIPVMRGLLAEPDLAMILAAPSGARRARPARSATAAGVTAPNTPFAAPSMVN